jgi:hypothetical protein
VRLIIISAYLQLCLVQLALNGWASASISCIAAGVSSRDTWQLHQLQHVLLNSVHILAAQAPRSKGPVTALLLCAVAGACWLSLGIPCGQATSCRCQLITLCISHTERKCTCVNLMRHAQCLANQLNELH